MSLTFKICVKYCISTRNYFKLYWFTSLRANFIGIQELPLEYICLMPDVSGGDL